MNKIDLIINTFIEPIYDRIEAAISALENQQLNDDEKIKQIEDNIKSIKNTSLKNCEREIENGFTKFKDIQSELPEGLTFEGMTNDFVKFHDTLKKNLQEFDFKDINGKTLNLLEEIKQRVKNYRQVLESIITWDNVAKINKTGEILKEIENMEQELKAVFNKPEDMSNNVDTENIGETYQLPSNNVEELSAYDRFMQTINEPVKDEELFVDDIINDIKDSIDNDYENQNISKEEYLLNDLKEKKEGFNEYIKEINIDDENNENDNFQQLKDIIDSSEEELPEVELDYIDVKDDEDKDLPIENLNQIVEDFNDYINKLNKEEPKDELSELVYSYVKLNKQLDEKERELSENKLMSNKFVKRIIAQTKLNKEILEVKLQMYNIDLNQVLINPEQAIEDARKRKKILGTINITYVGDYDKLLRIINLINLLRVNDIEKYQIVFPSISKVK